MSSLIGIRELRQNLSVYLRQVANGKSLVITDRREPVAVLGPLPEREEPWDRLLSKASLTAPKKDLLAEAKPVDVGKPYAGSEAIEEQRGENSL